MGFDHRITVFTPTYNRAYIIENLYHSLQEQDFLDFEWLVIDDGSTDGTEILFQKLIKEKNNFQIRYYRQNNGGKCRAINKALDLARGELFFTVDSDDYLTKDALSKINVWFIEIANKKNIQGIVANRGYSETETLNYIFMESHRDLSLLDMYSIPKEKNKVGNGERALIFYTDFHRKYKYPEFEGENFMTEAVTWNRMAHDGFKMRFYNDIIWIFEYKQDGLTNSGFKLFEDNPRGYGLCLKELSKFRKERLFKKVKMYYSFTCDLKHRYSDKTIAECIGTKTIVISACRLVSDIKKWFFWVINNC